MHTLLTKFLVWILVFVLLILFAFELNAGPSALRFAALLQNISADQPNLARIILFELRLPRALLAMCVGGALGLAGAALQGLLRNPLAEPGLMGVSSCASLGAIIALYFGLSASFSMALPLMGMLGAALSVLSVFLLAGWQGNVMTLLLAGLAVNALASSLIALALNFAPSPYAMSEMVFWLLGSLANRSLADFFLAFPFMLLGCVLLLTQGRFLSALSLGEDSAQSLGFNVSQQRALLIIGVALCVGPAIAISGSIGFVGLVVPHLLRPLVAQEPGALLPVSLLGGGVMVLLADIGVQYVSPMQDLKLGVLTALVGGPFLLYLIAKTRKTLL